MEFKYLIKDTTREERLKIVRDSLGEEGCANCGGCSLGAGEDMYQDYIDGIREISEITHDYYKDHFYRHDD